MDELTSTTFDLADRQTARTLHNDVVENRAYDPAGNVTGIRRLDNSGTTVPAPPASTTRPIS